MAKMRLLSFAAVVGISACGGGSSDRLSLGVAPVFSGPTQPRVSDFVGRTFPFRAVNLTTEGQIDVSDVRGAVEVVDDDTIRVIIDGDVETFRFDPRTDFYVANDGDVADVIFSQRSLHSYDVDNDGKLALGVIGFETPDADIPRSQTVFYEGTSFVVFRDETEGLLASEGTSAASVDFRRGDAVFILHDGDLGFFESDGSVPISGGQFSGRIVGEARSARYGDTELDLFSSRFEGRFYGPDADVVGGTMRADYEADTPDLSEGSIGGTFEGQRTD